MTVAALWARLAAVRRCALLAESSSVEGGRWRRSGDGMVRTTRNGVHRLDWEESGTWRQDAERPIPYRNRLRWEWDGVSTAIQLHHLRRGPEHPVHLAELIPLSAQRFASADPHHCDPDQYHAELLVRGDRLELCWQVTGPAKTYTLQTTYSP